jgi:CheY-like chemotaxis protein
MTRKVLLVDDEEDLRRIGQLGLSVVGKMQVVQADNGLDALEKARTERPDVILLDVLMPGIDGPTTCERLKADEATRDIPVIFLTANTQPHEIDHYLAIGALGVLKKPFDPMTLAAEVRRILGEP